MSKLSTQWLVVLLGLGTIASLGCNGVQRDVSKSAPYDRLIGKQYEVVGSVEGIAIRPYGANDPAYISISSTEPNRYSGSEVVFRRDIARGTRFKIVAAGLNDTMLDDTYFFVIEFQQPLDPKLPVHLRLRGDLGEPDGRLNPRLFKEID